MKRCLAITLITAMTFLLIGDVRAASLNESSNTSSEIKNTHNESSYTKQRYKELTQEQLATFFQGYQASFVLLDTKTNKYLRYNPDLCSKRLSPCSTFKIFNSLVGLETEVLTSENYPMYWDGTVHERSECNKDQTLQSAVTNSVVWYFQKVALAVGEERMKKFIQLSQYGNQDISGGITKFWLGNTLKISADEQVLFLSKLISDKLPFSKSSMAVTRGLIRLDQTADGTLYGKTGTASNHENNKNVLGWFVGYVVQPGRIYIFATNIQANDNAYGPQAREITKNILSAASLL
jgi:beta-lactamase class D